MEGLWIERGGQKKAKGQDERGYGAL